MSEAKHTPVVVAFDSAYPGSMFDRPDGSYVRRDDPASLAAALLETIERQKRRIEDLEAALDFGTDLYGHEKSTGDLAMALYEWANVARLALKSA
jgi:hypothetical protein